MSENNNHQYALPDSSYCQGEQLPTFDVVKCIHDQHHCIFAFHFNRYGFVCRHPRRDEIVEKTKAMSGYVVKQNP